MKSIASRENPDYKKLLRIVQRTKESRNLGRTIIDGPHLVADYRAHAGLPELLLVSESGWKRAEIGALMEQFPGVDVILLKDTLFKPLCGVESPAGIAAVIAVPKEIPAPIDGRCVLLDGVQDAGNVGSILRSSAAAGIRDVLLGPGCAAAWSMRVMRAAQGAHFRLRIRESADLGEFLRHYQGRSFATVVSGGISLHDAKLSGDVAWLFGSEGRGVRAELLLLVSESVTIPLSSGTESLNVAAAAAVCLFARTGRE
jgi:RNA methyltransferase, TrmH family